MSIDAKTLEQRLVTKDSVLAASSSLSRAAAKLCNLGGNLKNSVALEQFLREMMLLKLETERSLRVYDSSVRHMEELQCLQSSILDNTAATEQDIIHLKQRLTEEKKLRIHRLECEAIAAKVNQYKSVSFLQKKIAESKSNQRETIKKMDTIDCDIRTRKSQFDSLLTALLDLESQIIQTTAADENDSDGEDVRDRTDRDVDNDDNAETIDDAMNDNDNDNGDGDGDAGEEAAEESAIATVDESETAE